MSRQPDLFLAEPDAGLWDRQPVQVFRPDPERIRRRLYNILAEVRAADSEPLKPTRLSLYRTIFPQMAGFLPPDEGDQLRFEFAQEMERLARAA